MRIWNFPLNLFPTLFFLCISTSLFAQQIFVVQFQGASMRAPLVLPKGTSTISLCGLTRGNEYTLTATCAAFGQRSNFEIASSDQVGDFSFLKDNKKEALLTATAGCMDIQVKTLSEEQGETVPMFLSVSCNNCTAVKGSKGGQADQAVLQTQGGFTAKQLIEDVLVGGGCFQISNVIYDGVADQIGKFSNGLTNIGFSEGVIMTTGNIDNAPGPNDSNGQGGTSWINNSNDPDLASLATGDIGDKAVIEFDFVPTQNQVAFEFAFASEEYCEYVNSNFNDVFGFFISGPGIIGNPDIALIPNTNTPITINNLNHIFNSNYYIHNTPSITPQCAAVPPATGNVPLEIQYDGLTKKMVAVANVIPCQTYHIKLGVADVGDKVWDSAVFLRANSFNAGGTVLASPAYPGGFGSAYENCDEGNIRFVRGNGDVTQPLVINFTVGGSATPGVDYVPISSPVTIPAGQTEILVPINVIPDALAEVQENIQVTIPNACTCSQGVVEFLINDRPAISLVLDNQILCEGETAALSPNISGGLPGNNYLWSTGETTATISPSASGLYNLTVSDGCGGTATAVAELNFTPCGCAAETFIKTIGEAGQNARGYGVFDSQDGNFYITGTKKDSALIIKMTPSGALLWMRAFDVRDGTNDNISELIIDSEGMLVGCGQSGDFQSLGAGFVFRYNPVTNNMQWLNTFGLESPNVFGLMELANGNYLIYDNTNNLSNDTRMLEITRPDGTIDASSPLSQKINLGERDLFSSATIHNGKLYGVGLFTLGSGFANMRNAISRIDLATGNVDWTRLFHIGFDGPAPLVGKDLLIEDDHIISVSFGDEIGTAGFNDLIFLQKTDLAGNLVWMQSFDIFGVNFVTVDEVISVPDGFVLYARGNISNSSTDLYLIKTNKNGVLQWAKKLDYGFREFVGGVDGILSPFQSQILLKDNHLFFIASTQENGTSSQMLIAKTTLDGTVEGDCDYIKPIAMANWEILNPINLAVMVQEVPFNETTSTIVRTPQNTILAVENHCEVSLNQVFNFSICPGESVTIDEFVYTQDTTFSVEIPGTGGCDTLRTYTIDVLPQPMLAESVALCPGEFVIIGGQMIDHAGVFILQLDGANGDCDTIVTYTISQLPYQTRSENISFCPGGSVTIGGQLYTQSGTVVDTISAATGCDTIVTYTLTKLSQPTLAETILFCPGETVILGGTSYTQPGTIVRTLPSTTGGCDTIATYTLQFSTPAPSNLSIACPGAITIDQPNGSGGAVVNYDPATVASDCHCPGLDLSLTSGLPSGSNFPMGATSVCYTVKDSCGQTASCCFNVSIGEDDPCDTKVVSCLQYELLTITADMGGNRTYRIRVTNNCPNKLIYTTVQVPSGLVAIEPANLSTYTAPSGNTYRVRSPNFMPQYSVRYSSISDSIHNGESDIFKYTLPSQAAVTYIHVVSRLAPYVYLGAHLNTFYCPIGVTLNGSSGDERDDFIDLIDYNAPIELHGKLFLFPNPTSGELFADFTPWQGEQLNVQVVDSRGQRVQQRLLLAADDAQLFDLPSELPNGLYFMEVLTEKGEKHSGRFVVQR